MSPQRRQMGAPIEQIVDLDQVERPGFATTRPSGASARCPARARWSTPWSRERRAAAGRLGDEIAGDRLRRGRTSARCRSSGRRHRPAPAAPRAAAPARGIVGADIEHLPGAEPDHRHRLAGRRDRARDHRASAAMAFVSDSSGAAHARQERATRSLAACHCELGLSLRAKRSNLPARSAQSR